MSASFESRLSEFARDSWGHPYCVLAAATERTTTHPKPKTGWDIPRLVQLLCEKAEPAIALHEGKEHRRKLIANTERWCKEVKAGHLAVPLCDQTGRVFGIQFIAPKPNPKTGRDKTYWPPACPVDGHYYLVGSAPQRLCLVAEGFATALTLHETTGQPVAIAFAQR